MTLKMIGCLCIFFSCGSTGFLIAAQKIQEEHILRQISSLLQFMEQELEYQLTPLPELIHKSAKQTHGILKAIMRVFSEKLTQQHYPDAASCMAAALQEVPLPSRRIETILRNLGNTLGRFDLPNQLRGLSALKSQCDLEWEVIRQDQALRLKSYRTLGICAGIALAVLLI